MTLRKTYDTMADLWHYGRKVSYLQLVKLWLMGFKPGIHECNHTLDTFSPCHFQFQISISIFSISNNFFVSQYTFSTIHMYTKRLHQHIHKQFSESIQCYGSKWSWKSCWIYGLLVWYTKYHLSQQGCKGAGGATVTTHFVSNMQHTAL